MGQRLAGARPRPTRAGILETIRRIGYLQLDPTNVVARNPYLVLWSRLGGYDRGLLDDLLAKHRDVFETPSLILPMSDLPLHLATMREYRRATDGIAPGKKGRLEGAGGGTWPKRAAAWLKKNPHVRRRVLVRLRREGPLPLTAFEDRNAFSWSEGEWDDERNITMLLAILQRRGEVVVSGRQGGKKLWAVADGWYPKVAPLAPGAVARESILRALRAMGLATLKHLRWYYAFNRHVSLEGIEALEKSGEVVRVEVEGVPGTFYTAADVERRLRAVRNDWEGRTTLLSPFDPLIMDRARLEALFGYFYRIEIYTPVPKRRLGFWAMPVLHGDRIVGSVDPKVDREKGELIVNKVVLEKGAPRSAMPAIRGAVDELAEWAGATRVRWPRP